MTIVILLSLTLLYHIYVAKLLEEAFSSRYKKMRENLPYIIFGYPRCGHDFLPLLKEQLKREDDQVVLDLSKTIRI